MIWMLGLTAAMAGDCTAVGMEQVRAIAPPAVVVLGERYGHQPDLARAKRIIREMLGRSPVTVALEAVDVTATKELDRYAAGELNSDGLRAALDWEATWGFPWTPYEPLLTAHDYGASVVGIGVPRTPPPKDAEFPIPGGYMTILRDAMAGYEMPLGMQSRFVRTMAWRDHALARNAIEAWDEDGYLVLVVGRGHVEGGKGVAWQARTLTSQKVDSIVLAWADAACYDGDQIWKKSLWEQLY